jgi:hypothetical protein
MALPSGGYFIWPFPCFKAASKRRHKKLHDKPCRRMYQNV